MEMKSLVAVLVVVLLSTAPAVSGFPFRYPGILLCATSAPAPQPLCQYRSASFQAFTVCGKLSVINVTLNGSSSTSQLWCSAYNQASLRHNTLTAKDTGSIITFLQQKSTDLVNYVSLWNSHLPIPSSLDEFTDLIYVFKEHGLVTVQGRYGNGASPADYSNGLHTHADPSPQELWVRLDPLYAEVTPDTAPIIA